MREGQVASDLIEKFNLVLQAVLETGKTGKMSIDLSISPSRVAIGGAVVEVEMEHNIKLRTPQLSIGKSAFFVSHEGELTRDNPAQAAMFEKETKEQANGK